MWTAQIADAADAVGIDADTLEAQVLIESAGHSWAFNPEPRYRYLWDIQAHRPFRAVTDAELYNKVPPADFHGYLGQHDQEWWGQQTSWGLMQIMGAVARERGFTGPYLAELCHVPTNLALGAGLMKDLIGWAGGDVGRALAAFNGGKGGWHTSGPLNYAAKILQLVGE